MQNKQVQSYWFIMISHEIFKISSHAQMTTSEDNDNIPLHVFVPVSESLIMLSFRGQIKLEPSLDWSLTGALEVPCQRLSLPFVATLSSTLNLIFMCHQEF